MGILDEIYNLPVHEHSEEKKKQNDLLAQKLKEYQEHFNDDFATEFLPMSIDEIIANIDKCIKYNRKWEGFIVPELEEDALI